MYHTFGVRAKNLFDGDFPQQSLRLHAPNVGGLGSIPGQGTRFYMLQGRACMLHLNIPRAAAKS